MNEANKPQRELCAVFSESVAVIKAAAEKYEQSLGSDFNGDDFTIVAPVTLFVLVDDEGGVSHRVIASNGRTYRPERGWVGISWKPGKDQPAFVA